LLEAATTINLPKQVNQAADHLISRLFAEHLGKRLRFDGLRAQVAGHIERIPNDNLLTIVPADDAQKRFCVLTALGANQGHDRLGGEANIVGDGDADATVADIETEQSPMRVGQTSG
jgi:hypothetical protein